ncbi:hypothetical protein JHK87_048018 [Glycine soja]|nr:hypothetical protein JHK87_048018 [Glycine soja]
MTRMGLYIVVEDGTRDSHNNVVKSVGRVERYGGGMTFAKAALESDTGHLDKVESCPLNLEFVVALTWDMFDLQSHHKINVIKKIDYGTPGDVLLNLDGLQ